ncbi:MAG: N-acetylmuramoyl-L-alanine amidase [Phycisphaeraceae bacterium]
MEDMGLHVTLDIPDGLVAASDTEQLASMTAAGLNPVGTQPVGALTGKIVYVHAGHGYTADNLGDGSWSFQRPLLFDIIEDLSNQDMMTFLVDFLWNAGATVVPLRPVGHQVNEVVLDNDDPEVTFVGSWNNSVSSVYYGDVGDVPYRYASTSATETAYARYRPNIPEAGFYPVYAWTRAGSDRVDQLYKVTHSGGTTEVRVNHKRVGTGLVYLGTYHFEQGTEGYVDISNRSSQPGVVIADMIRFGNGMGDVDRGGGVSGLPREDEPALYWIQAHIGQGIPDSEYRVSSRDRDATVSASPRWAEFMNREADGSLSDRVFISYHSNAGGGSSRGVLGLYNGNNDPNSATPNQFLLADTVAREVNDDMVALNGTFEHNWFNRTTVTLDRSDIEFGEINNNRINDEFDATIIEWAYHDNALDTDLMRDADVRNAVARATYQGLQRYFNIVDGGATGLTFLPDPVTDVMATTNGDGTVTISWTPPAVSGIGGGTPTGYLIYTSLNGYGFDGGTFVPGGTTTSHVMTGLDPANGTHYFKVVAVNAGGQSLGSEVVAATPLATPPASKVLIVNGFDRIDKETNYQQTISGVGVVDRVRPRFQNSRDYAVQVAEAIEAFNPALGIDTVQNENVIDLDVSLTDYDTVVWILGEESSADETFNAAEQFLVSNFITNGGDLFVSGTEIGWDLDNLNNGRSFYNNTLRADYVSDDAGTHTVTGVTGSIFEGLTFSFDDGTLFYDSEFPDVINPTAGAVSALSYVGGIGGGAAIQKKGSADGDVVMLAFPFETITTAADRAQVMEAVLTFFGTPPSEIPGPPSALAAIPGNNSVILDWADNTEPDLAGYNIYRATVSGGPYTKLNSTPVALSQFTDNTVTNGTLYFYQVTAVDTDDNESVPSLEVSVTPDDHGDDKDNATVVSVPSITDGHMASGDSDWYEFNLLGNTDYTLTVVGNGLSGAEIRLYSSGLTLLASDSGSANGSTLAEIQYSVTFGDIYYAEVVGNGGATGNYQLAAQETDDHGNTTAEATDLLTAFAVGTIEVTGDIDFFRVPVLNGLTYTFTANDLGVPDAILTLYDSGGVPIQQVSGSNPGGVHAQIVWSASMDGDVYLSVEAQPGSLGDYLVTVSSATQLVGDLDGDGFVGISDLNIVLGNWNQNVTAGDWTVGDPSGDGFVGIEDLNQVLGNWNAGTPPQAQTTLVAEPDSQQYAEQVAPVTQQERHARQGQQRGVESVSGSRILPIDQRAHLALANHHGATRSAFIQADTEDTEEVRPVIGLWEPENSIDSGRI